MNNESPNVMPGQHVFQYVHKRLQKHLFYHLQMISTIFVHISHFAMKLIWYTQQITYYLHTANMKNAIHYTNSVVNCTCKVLQ